MHDIFGLREPFKKQIYKKWGKLLLWFTKQLPKFIATNLAAFDGNFKYKGEEACVISKIFFEEKMLTTPEDIANALNKNFCSVGNKTFQSLTRHRRRL